MFKSVKHAKDIDLRTVFVIKTFRCLEFLSFGVVSCFLYVKGVF